MSRREGRESYSMRHRSRFNRELSPKRSRRDAKPTRERKPNKTNVDPGDHTDRDQKHHLWLQDALPLEAPLASDPKVETGAVSKESEKKPSGHHVGHKLSSDPTDVSLFRSYFQHNGHGNARNVGRSFGRRATTELGWRDSKDQHGKRAANKTAHDTRQSNEKSQVKGDDDGTRHHDGFFEMEADPPPPARKRPAFREKKIPVESENADKAATEPVKSQC